MAVRQGEYGTTRALRVHQTILAIFFGSFVGGIVTVFVAVNQAGGLQGFVTSVIESPGQTPVSPFLWGFAATAIVEMLYVFFVVEVRGISMRDGLGLSWHPVDYQWALGLAIAVVGSGYLLLSLLLPAVGINVSDGVESQYPSAFGNASEGERLALIAIIGLLVPIAEELLFRGVALRAIEARVGPVVAVVGSSLVFSLAHAATFTSADIPILLFSLVAGLMFGTVTVLTGRLGPSIAAHAANNLLVTILATS